MLNNHANGTGLAVLTHNSNPTFPRYTHDGGTIYFSTYTGFYSLWRMSADGANPNQITFNDQDAYSPAPSPDGTQLAYNSFSERNFEGFLTSNSDIYISRADGSAPLDITPGSAGQRNSDLYPAWSPDGDYLAYATERCDTTGSSCIDIGDITAPQEKTEIRLTPAGWNVSEPTWGPE